MILEKIESPLDQLFLSDSGCNIFNPYIDGTRIVPRLNGVKTLVLSIDIYVRLNELYPDSIPLVQNLQLFSSFHEEIAGERILPFLPRVTKSIHFYSLHLPKELFLSLSIEELSFENCNVINNLSSPLPNLRIVRLLNSCIYNLNDFNHLEELTIDESQIFAMTNYSALFTAKKLHIEWS